MYEPHDYSVRPATPSGAGAGGPRGRSPLDPSWVAEGNLLRCLASHRGAAPFAQTGSESSGLQRQCRCESVERSSTGRSRDG
jgi:hypothetical protein